MIEVKIKNKEGVVVIRRKRDNNHKPNSYSTLHYCFRDNEDN